MFRIMIVDDEPIAVRSLKYMIDSGAHDCEVVGSAGSGREAILMANELRPDVVVMDINMPGINGLEVIRRLRETAPNMRFIIASAFDYFDYAVEAASLEVTEYLLKPIGAEKLLAALKRVCEKLSLQRERAERELELREKLDIVTPVLDTGFINALCMGGDNSEELRCYYRLFEFPYEACYVMTVEFTDRDGSGGRIGEHYPALRDFIKKSGSFAVGPLMVNKIIICGFCSELKPQSRETRIHTATALIDKARSQGLNARVGIGGAVQSVGDARLSYRQSLRALGTALRSPDTQLLLYDELPTSNSALIFDIESVFERQLAPVLSDGRSAACAQMDSLLSDCSSELRGNFEVLRSVMLSLMLCLERSIPENLSEQGDAQDNAQFLVRIVESACESELREQCISFVGRVADMISAGNKNKVHSIIRRANEFINENYMREIMLEDVAREVSLSPYYFSRFYKNETGISFIEKLTAVRIEKAKECIRTTDMPMKEIARTVGYLDANYFSKLFKKIVGVTASEYKESN